MHIPNDFKEALQRAYTNAGELDKLFVDHQSFIMRLVNHSKRFNHWAVISDEEDLFQEACIWLVNSLWEWNEEKNTPLAEYVVYNIGVRLRNHVEKEKRQKRHPKTKPKSLYADNASGFPFEETIDGNEPTPESNLIVKRAYDRIERELPLLARELLDALIVENGNFSSASRRILHGGRVRRVRGMSDDAFRQALRKNIFSQLRTILVEEHIISV
jgi:DNA-directed RNA polymerase specialized sigma24 family protein